MNNSFGAREYCWKQATSSDEKAIKKNLKNIKKMFLNTQAAKVLKSRSSRKFVKKWENEKSKLKVNWKMFLDFLTFIWYAIVD